MFTTLITTAPTYLCLFWTIVFLLEYKRTTAERRIMFWFMLTATVLYFGHFCYFNHYVSVIPVTDTLYSFANLAVYPIYYMYVRRVTTGKPLTFRTLLLLLPALAIGSANAVLYSMMDEDNIQDFINSYLYHESLSYNRPVFLLTLTHRAAMVIFACMLVWIVYRCYKMTKSFENELHQFYSNREGREISPIMTLQICVLIASIGSAILNALSKSFFVDNNLVLAIPSLTFSALLYALAYDAHKRTFTAEVFKEDERKADTTEAKRVLTEAKEDLQTVTPSTAEAIIPFVSEETEEKQEILSAKILDIMNTQKLFLHPDLKITELAEALGTNRTYITRSISSELHTSFADLVNKMRIDHAKQLMQNDTTLTKAEIAIKSGYSHESSFYRNFLKHEGCSPTDWVRQHT